MKYGCLFALAVSTIFAVNASARPAHAANFDVAVFHTEADGYSQGFKYFADKVRQRTEGRVVLVPHYAGSLVTGNETFLAVRDNVVPAGVITASGASAFVRQLAFAEIMGGLPGDAKSFQTVAESLHPILKKLFREQGVEYLWIQPAYAALMLCRNSHVIGPEDWKGKRLRMAGRWQALEARALGGLPVTIDPSEIYIALQQGTVDCALMTHSLAQSLRLYEVAKKVTPLEMNLNAVLYIINPRVWQGISAADRAAIEEVSKESQAWSISNYDAYQKKAFDAVMATGVDRKDPTPAQMSGILAGFKPAFDAAKKEIGEAGKEALDIISKYSKNW